jgi:hypothetical protein
MLNSRARHSAAQESCVVSHAAALTQAAQLPAGCATTIHGDMHPASTRITTAAFTIASRSGAADYGRT